MVVATGAALDLLHYVLPGESYMLLRNLTPDAVGPLARAAAAFAGLALLYAARGLARRKRRALGFAVAVDTFSMAIHVLWASITGRSSRLRS